MRSFTQLFVAATAFTSVLAQYNDGYETVNLPTDPVQIRVAYQGPTAMMGESAVYMHAKIDTKHSCHSLLEYF
jgi:hypothetical protein